MGILHVRNALILEILVQRRDIGPESKACKQPMPEAHQRTCNKTPTTSTGEWSGCSVC